MEVEMIDTATALKLFLNDLPLTVNRPNLFIDLEGNNLSKHGTLSLITILVEPRHKVYLVDVHMLGKDAFKLANENGVTLQQILESNAITKVFFDIRHDSEALFHLYGVKVAGIEDLQLVELAGRAFSKAHVHGLAKCIERDSLLSFAEKQQWKATKDQGVRLFDPGHGGSYAVFDKRPLSTQIAKYCAQDVLHMPGLRRIYIGRLDAAWKAKVQTETNARIALSQSAQGVGKGPQNAKGPLSWQENQPECRTADEFIEDLLDQSLKEGDP